MKYFICLFGMSVLLSFNPTGGCPETGDSSDTDIQKLDVLKNRHTKPDAEQINGTVTFASLFNAGDHDGALNQKEGASIEGLLVDGTQEKGESCNCHTKDLKKRDIHVYISTSANAPLKDCQVVEVTAYSKEMHPEWNSSFVHALRGHRVRITGWLFYDAKHSGESWATHPDWASKKLKRHNLWEIHPITAIEDLGE